MSEIDVWLADAFTDRPLEGNPACVVLEPGEIDDRTSCRITAELGVSETAFVSCVEEGGSEYHTRFFTRSQEVDICGHATVGAFWALAAEGRVPLTDGANHLVQTTNLGRLPVTIEAAGGKPVSVMMEQTLPRFETPEVNLDKIAALFGLGRKQMSEELPVEIVSTGLRSLHIPLTGVSGFPDLRMLRRGVLDLSQTLDVSMVQLFSMETNRFDANAHCRVFAPAVGIDEDPVTGTAAGALGAYIVRHGLLPARDDGVTRAVIEQGEEMGRPGLVRVEVEHDAGEFTAVRVGGTAVISLKGRLRISL